MAWLLENPKVGGIRNVGTGKAASFNDLVVAVFAALGREPVIEYVDMPETLRGKYQAFTQADMSWLGEVGCPVRFASLEDGVTDYVRMHLEADDRFI